MSEDNTATPDLAPLRQWVHDLNNHIGVILSASELLQMEALTPKASEKARAIEGKALEAREILRRIADRFL